jgi:hypothetical protein
LLGEVGADGGAVDAELGCQFLHGLARPAPVDQLGDLIGEQPALGVESRPSGGPRRVLLHFPRFTALVNDLVSEVPEGRLRV